MIILQCFEYEYIYLLIYKLISTLNFYIWNYEYECIDCIDINPK